MIVTHNVKRILIMEIKELNGRPLFAWSPLRTVIGTGTETPGMVMDGFFGLECLESDARLTDCDVASSTGCSANSVIVDG